MPLPRIWSECSKDGPGGKDEWADHPVSKILLVEVTRLAGIETANGEKFAGTNPPMSAYHVCRASGMRDVAKLIQRAIDDAKPGDDEDDEAEEGSQSA